MKPRRNFTSQLKNIVDYFPPLHGPARNTLPAWKSSLNAGNARTVRGLSVVDFLFEIAYSDKIVREVFEKRESRKSMPQSAHTDNDVKLANLLELAEALLRGDYDAAKVDCVGTDGLVPQLAKKINQMLHNLRDIEAPLINAGDSAPELVNKAKSISDLMNQSTGEVLDKSDKLTELADSIEKTVNGSKDACPVMAAQLKDQLMAVKAASFDIIASQSYQDVARQKIESMIKDLNQMQDWLIKALIVLNLRSNSSKENFEKKVQMLSDVKKSDNPEIVKQDLVDDLLAEFGF